METINTVKETVDGWIINDHRVVKSHMTDDPYYIAIQDWITGGNTPDPVFADSITELEAARADTIKTIKDQFEVTANAPVDVSGVLYDGGYDSALKLDAARRLAEKVGNTTVTFYDASNVAHELSLADADTVIIAIASAYQAALADKQTKLTQAQQATTLAELPTV